MARFNNLRATGVRTTNEEGHLAYKLDAKTELVQRVSTWFVNEPKFYGDTLSENQRIVELIERIAKSDPEFILKLAKYTRQESKLRQAPIVLLVEASLIDECQPYVREYTPHILTRPDQLTECMAYLFNRTDRVLPISLKKGIRDTWNNFNEYQLAKYNRKGEWTLADVMRLTHPKPKGNSKLFKRLLEDQLKTPRTWETIISEKGSTKETWESIMPDMGVLAVIRNFNNFIKVGANLDLIRERITNPKGVLPFQFLAAYERLSSEPNAGHVLPLITEGLEASINNLESLPGNTFISVDHSGSMSWPISDKNSLNRAQAGNTLAAIANKLSEKCTTSVFSHQFKVFSLNPRGDILDNTQKINSQLEWGSTDLSLPFKYIDENKLKYDRIIIITDEQGNTGHMNQWLKAYRKYINPNVYCYIINIGGYGTTEVPQGDTKTIHIAGFSEKIFDFIPVFEQGIEKQVKYIENYE